DEHPNVVSARFVRTDIPGAEGVPFLFLEYCAGGSLAEWMDQGRTRDLKAALAIGIQLARGLAHCHGKKTVHRDFKPLNVMMTQDGTAKVTDFGTVKFAALESGAEEVDASGQADLRRT